MDKIIIPSLTILLPTGAKHWSYLRIYCLILQLLMLVSRFPLDFHRQILFQSSWQVIRLPELPGLFSQGSSQGGVGAHSVSCMRATAPWLIQAGHANSTSKLTWAESNSTCIQIQLLSSHMHKCSVIILW